MKQFMILAIGCLVLSAGPALAQEVVITDFPLGVGGSIDPDLFKPYYAQLKAISDTLRMYPLARAIVTGGADGEQYRETQDAHNPGLALGRAHILRNLLISEFKVDSTQIIIQSTDGKTKGPQYRYAGVRVDRDMSDLEARLDKRLDSLENRPPDVQHFTEVKEITKNLAEHMGLQLSIGASSSPFGGIPIVGGAVTWKRIVYVEGIWGHTFWNGSFQYNGYNLNTKSRLAGGNLIVYPYKRLPVGIVGGWIRIEEIYLDSYEYVKMSEGPMLGLRASPLSFLSITGTYNPSRHRIAGEYKSRAKNGQFLVSITAHKTFGGEK
jgi:hypothetical protein